MDKKRLRKKLKKARKPVNSIEIHKNIMKIDKDKAKYSRAEVAKKISAELKKLKKFDTKFIYAVASTVSAFVLGIFLREVYEYVNNLGGKQRISKYEYQTPFGSPRTREYRTPRKQTGVLGRVLTFFKKNTASLVAQLAKNAVARETFKRIVSKYAKDKIGIPEVITEEFIRQVLPIIQNSPVSDEDLSDLETIASNTPSPEPYKSGYTSSGSSDDLTTHDVQYTPSKRKGKHASLGKNIFGN
jgi:hypothetical protein